MNAAQKAKLTQHFYQKKYPLKLAAHRAGVSLFSARKYLLRPQCAPQSRSRSHISLSVIKFIDTLIEKQFGVISAIEIQKTIRNRFNILLSPTTINSIRRRLGWIKTGVKYCQLINKANIPVRFSWALQFLLTDERFLFDIEFDETSVVLDQRTRTICYRRKGYSTTLQPVPKHSLKVHLLGGISRFGKTPLIIFKRNLDSALLISIFSTAIVPWINEV